MRRIKTIVKKNDKKLFGKICEYLHQKWNIIGNRIIKKKFDLKFAYWHILINWFLFHVKKDGITFLSRFKLTCLIFLMFCALYNYFFHHITFQPPGYSSTAAVFFWFPNHYHYPSTHPIRADVGRIKKQVTL